MNLELWKKSKLQQLQAKIVLLQVFNETPAPPTEHIPLDSAISSPSRALPFIKEKELVEALAFLASTTDDPGKVIAVCVEEGSGGQSMTINLAVNNGELANVVEGFKKMATILQSIARKEAIIGTNKADLLREAVTLNQTRILCRLKSKYAVLKCRNRKAKMGRPKVIPTLSHAIAELTSCCMAGLSSEENQQLRENGQELKRLFDELEHLPRLDATSDAGVCVLINIVLTSHRLYNSIAFEPLLELSSFEDKRKSSIKRIVNKLSRYSTASRFLLEAATRFSIFKNIKVLMVKISPFPLSRVEEPHKVVGSVVDGLLDKENSKIARSRLQNRLNRQKIGYTSFCDSVFSTKFVVHAEIQLLFHYELQDCAFPPRVICSGKMACFLCNLFFKEHGKYFIPSTHGRVYEKWILPEDLSDLKGAKADDMFSVVEKFSDALGEVLKREILTPSKSISQPNESHVFNSAVWSEPLESMPNPIQRVDSGYDGEEKESVPSSSANIKSPVRQKSPYTMLTRGQSMSFEMSRYTQLVKVGTPRIHLTFSYNTWEHSWTSLAHANAADIGCRLGLTWLEDTETLDPCSTVVDLAKFPESFQETFDQLAGSCDFYVRKGQDTVGIQTTYL